ncbi:MAG: DUF1289 domain-containing protein [Bacteroidales bacterium]|nr:DUF1289 domain-containing protein [Bacteroidales bacterium]
MQTSINDDILSPCNNKCQLDVDKTYCISCFRTVAEKKKWWSYSKEEKLQILTELKERSKKW